MQFSSVVLQFLSTDEEAAEMLGGYVWQIISVDKVAAFSGKNLP